MFKTVAALDIGSRNTKIALKNRCEVEKTLLSLNVGAKRSVRAVGSAAIESGGLLFAPIRYSSAANEALLSEFLKRLVGEKTGRRDMRFVELYIALERTLPEIKKRSIMRAAAGAGFYKVRAVDAALMGALGAGVDIFSNSTHMVVDIGANSIVCAATANGGILFETRENFGSNLTDRAIGSFFLEKHGVELGERTCEIIKKNLENITFSVDGRSLENSLPKTVFASDGELKAAAEKGVEKLVSFAEDFIRLISVECAADLHDTGITLIGGGALMHGMAEAFSSRLGVKCMVSENALNATADGMQKLLFSGMGEYAAIVG